MEQIAMVKSVQGNGMAVVAVQRGQAHVAHAQRGELETLEIIVNHGNFSHSLLETNWL